MLDACLAGLQSGMVGVLWMLAWLGLSAAWQRRSFWTPENLLATLFYGDAAIRPQFSFQTLSGLAVYLILYSLLGAVFATAVKLRLARLRLYLLSIVFALSWYYIAYHILWKAASPLIALLYPERATLVGHLLYGVILAGYPKHIPRTNPPEPMPSPVQSVSSPDPA